MEHTSQNKKQDIVETCKTAFKSKGWKGSKGYITYISYILLKSMKTLKYN